MWQEIYTWQQTIEIDEHLARKLIESQTSLVVETISFLGRGFDNIVYLVNNTYVFRFPTREIGVTCMYNEINLSGYIKKYVSFPFSYPKFIGQPTTQYPAPFMGYPFLQGKPLSQINAEAITDQTFAITLAQWLKQLHSVPIEKSHFETIQEWHDFWSLSQKERVENTKAYVQEHVDSFLHAGFEKKELFDALNLAEKLDFEGVEKKSYCHGDLDVRHLLIDDQKKLSGIIDWGDLHIGCAGIDLSIAYMILDESAQKTFFKEYGYIDQKTANYARFVGLYDSIHFLPFCFDQADENLQKWSILGLRQGIECVSKSS